MFFLGILLAFLIVNRLNHLVFLQIYFCVVCHLSWIYMCISNFFLLFHVQTFLHDFSDGILCSQIWYSILGFIFLILYVSFSFNLEFDSLC